MSDPYHAARDMNRYEGITPQGQSSPHTLMFMAANRRAPYMHQSQRLPRIADEIALMAGGDARKAQMLCSALLGMVAERTETK